MGISYGDFCRMSPAEFTAVYGAYIRQRESDFRDRWERMRLLGAITLQPHLKKNGRISPEKLIPLPWDRKARKSGGREKPELTPEQQRRRMEELARKLGDKI